MVDLLFSKMVIFRSCVKSPESHDSNPPQETEK